MNEEGGVTPEPVDAAAATGPSPATAAPGAPDALGRADGLDVSGGLSSYGADASPARLPLLPGFREMALRRMSQDRAG